MHILRRVFNWIRKQRRPEAKRGGLLLGVSASAHARNPFVIFPDFLRSQHLGIIGLSGSGKTYLIEHMIRQDIRNGTGFAIFDVHGDLSDSILAYLAERSSVQPDIFDRTLILEPFNPERSFGFNPLERTSGTSPFLQAQEFAYILRKRWHESLLSPRTEELLRTALYTLSVNDETLLTLSALLCNTKVRAALIQNLPPGEAKSYWTLRYDKLSPRMQAVFREPILSRISSFVADPQIRDIVGQQKSTFSFREAMQRGHWVILNLSVGRLGENSTILGSILFTKLELEIMGLAQVPEKDRRLFSVYADELQNLAGDSFGRLIAEARKFKIALVAGHQFWKQLDSPLRQAMLAVGSKALFRLHYHDAVELAGELSASEKNRYINLLTILEKGEAVVRLGPRRPVVISVPTHRPAKPSAADLQALRSQSARRYTRARTDIRKEAVAHRIERIDAITGKRGNQILNSNELNTL
jgi:hypothetical protein